MPAPAGGPAAAAPAPAAVERALELARARLGDAVGRSGEPIVLHAEGTISILREVFGDEATQTAAALFGAGDAIPQAAIERDFGTDVAVLVEGIRQVMRLRELHLRASGSADGGQLETLRRMLLAMAVDIRVVVLRLASRLQTLRWHAAGRHLPEAGVSQETLDVLAPLANRLGLWQLKWELEDLSFRFLQPAEYQRMARQVDETRAERERSIEAARRQLAALLAAGGLAADVQGRPKHLYSIWKKMQGKSLAFARVFDARALRVVVEDVAACYAALARVHEAWRPVEGEFDDYIARPKPNGYQSLHTVVLADDGRPLEVQIRTRAMHEHAEHGVAAHWMYKEAGARGYAGVSASGEFEERVADARKAVLRELLAWERDFTRQGATGPGAASFDDRIYVFTPQASIIDLPAGGTAVDFAYALHTDLGHRCRGARVDGAMVPLNTALANGQTVEVVAAKEGGPSMDWLNAELGYIRSPRSRAKVRAWFNAQAQSETIARGREAVEKLLQREGRTALKLDTLAEQLGFKNADALFEVVGKDEFSLRNIENVLRPVEPPPDDDRVALHRPRSVAGGGRGGVLVVGIDSLLTTLARCCRPAPPDAIAGFVTRGRGVAVHRADCTNLRHMVQTAPGRVIDVAWGAPGGDKAAVYPLDVLIEAADRPGLLRDISEVFSKDKMNVIAVHTQSAKDRSAAWMTFTVELNDASRLATVLAQIGRVPGVRHARRK